MTFLFLKFCYINDIQCRRGWFPDALSRLPHLRPKITGHLARICIPSVTNGLEHRTDVFTMKENIYTQPHTSALSGHSNLKLNYKVLEYKKII